MYLKIGSTILFVFLLFTFAFGANLEKGSSIIGGTASYFSRKYSDSPTSVGFQLTPSYTYAFNPNFGLGIKGNYSSTKYLDVTFKSVSVAPTVTCFINVENQNVIPYTSIGVYLLSKSDGGNSTVKETCQIPELSLGILCKVSSGLAIDIRAVYYESETTSESNSYDYYGSSYSDQTSYKQKVFKVEFGLMGILTPNTSSQ